MFIYTFARYGKRYERRFKTLHHAYGCAFGDVMGGLALPEGIKDPDGTVVLTYEQILGRGFMEAGIDERLIPSYRQTCEEVGLQPAPTVHRSPGAPVPEDKPRGVYIGDVGAE